jgi:cyclic pyranopterin phosphate synthase
MVLVDTLARPLRSLRLSVTDRCNLRCEYCMPEEEYAWLSRDDLLQFDEIRTLVSIFRALGVAKVRLTGGEPLLRRNLPDLVALLTADGELDVTLTTNGVLLGDLAEPLKAAGLSRLNISLDTMRPDRFAALTRQNQHAAVLDAIVQAGRLFSGNKLDTVVMRGVNDDELVDLIEYGASVGAEVRFIEYMDVGGATHWRRDLVVPRVELIRRLRAHFGPITPIEEPGSSAPAERFALPDGRTFGVIASTTEPFCRTCDRGRLTADGVFYSCLYATEGLPLRAPLRAGLSPAGLQTMLQDRWTRRADRAAEIRHELRDRSVFLPVTVLRADPHLEMHKRGG